MGKRPESVFVKGRFVYVADTGNDRVMVWPLTTADPNVHGTLVVGGNGRGKGLNQIIGPASLVIDSSEVEQGIVLDHLYVCDTYNHRIMKYRLNSIGQPDVNFQPVLAAGGCLQSPDYINPCVEGGLHYPPDPNPHRVDHINPAKTNPPVYHFWGPSSIFVGVGGTNLAIADTQNHRVLTWVEYR